MRKITSTCSTEECAETTTTKESKEKGGEILQRLQQSDQVRLKGTNLRLSHPSTKLAPKQYGPFTITDKISSVVFRLALPGHWAIHNIFHASLLIPYHKTSKHSVNFLEPPPEIIEGEEEYEVKQIVNSWRYGKGKKLQFLVH